MRKVAAGLLVLGFASTAFGGTVVFNGGGPIPDVDNSLGDAFVDIPVNIGTSEFASILSFDVIFGSDTLRFADGAGAFTFASGIPGAFLFSQINSPAIPPVYPDDVAIGAFAATPQTVAGLQLGTLHVIVPGGLAPGDYFVDVNPTRDNNGSSVGSPTQAQDPLSGRAVIHVVPEPATISLLGLAGLALLRRRKTV